MKENTETAQTLSVCLDSTTLDTGEGDDCVTSLRFCWNEYIFLFSSLPPLSLVETHTVGIAQWIPLEFLTQINQYTIIVCLHPCITLGQAAVGSSPPSPLFTLAVGRWCLYSEMAEWFPVCIWPLFHIRLTGIIGGILWSTIGSFTHHCRGWNQQLFSYWLILQLIAWLIATALSSNVMVFTKINLANEMICWFLVNEIFPVV